MLITDALPHPKAIQLLGLGIILLGILLPLFYEKWRTRKAFDEKA